MDRQTVNDNLQYVTDLGLVRQTPSGPQIANPIYREIIPRELNLITQRNFESLYQSAWYIDDDGCLNMHKLLTAFQEFFRQNAEHWVDRFKYNEAGPQLLIQAFLQRIVNGGGRIEREYGFGRKRTDICIIWPIRSDEDRERGYTAPSTPVQRVVIELKIRYGDLGEIIKDGLAQTWQYMDSCGTDEGHLIIFDRSTQKRSWDEKIFDRKESYQGETITVWGMWYVIP